MGSYCPSVAFSAPGVIHVALRRLFEGRAYVSHYSVVLSRGTRARTFRLRPGVLVGILSVVPVLAVGCFALTLLFVFRDDLLWSLMSRQAEMQYVYEDRLASMRTQIERLKSRELLNEQRAACTICFSGRRNSKTGRASSPVSPSAPA
jgi:hypothetical protein